MRREMLIPLVLLSVFLVIGWAGNKGEASNGKGTKVTTNPEIITVFADSSLNESFKEIDSKFEMENPGTYVNPIFNGSGSLRMQIKGEATVDVFASADETQMDTLGSESLIINNSRKDFAHNSLVLIVPATSTLIITSLKDLADPKVAKISICNPDTVPLGNYSRLALTDAGLWNQTKNKLILDDDVKQVLTYVERGDVDAGFVYTTDAKTAQNGTIKIVKRVDVSIPVTYPIAVISSSEHKENAQKFVNFVTESEGQAILKKHYFVVQS